MSHLQALAPGFLVMLVRLLARTWRIQLRDEAGLTDQPTFPPVIWVLWHNRLLVIPVIWQRFFLHRPGAALVSRSKDGAILADCIERFGGTPVRGSSSRGGAAALAEMSRKMKQGFDAFITPDGPRGPRYSIAPGVLWLAQMTRAPLMPVSVEFSATWRLGRWDGFFIPKPFSKIDLTLRPLHTVRETAGKEELGHEIERLRLSMMSTTKTL